MQKALSLMTSIPVLQNKNRGYPPAGTAPEHPQEESNHAVRLSDDSGSAVFASELLHKGDRCLDVVHIIGIVD